MAEKRLVFGLGSGRCGTASLAYLMSKQESTHSSHELHPQLPWDPSTDFLTHKWITMDHQAHLFDTVFDSGSYFLPYVQILINSWNQNSYANNRYDIRFICMKRDKKKTVSSFLKKFKKQNNNPLQNHGDPNLVQNSWDLSFPKYDDCSLKEALEKYYDDYYAAARDLEYKQPWAFRIFDVNSLNSESGVKSILEFAGYEKPEILTKIQKRKH